MSRSARLFASISGVIRRDWRIWRPRCWRVGYRYATSKMHSGTRTVGCCYQRRPCRSLGSGCGRITRRSPSATWVSTKSFICLLTASRLRPGAKREPVLTAWGFTLEGRRVLLHMMAGSKEDAETVTAFFEDMKRRGLNDPLLVTSDGAPGIIKAIEVCFPRAARQRCLAHRMRNLAA